MPKQAMLGPAPAVHEAWRVPRRVPFGLAPKLRMPKQAVLGPAPAVHEAWRVPRRMPFGLAPKLRMPKQAMLGHTPGRLSLHPANWFPTFWQTGPSALSAAGFRLVCRKGFSVRGGRKGLSASTLTNRRLPCPLLFFFLFQRPNAAVPAEYQAGNHAQEGQA